MAKHTRGALVAAAFVVLAASASAQTGTGTPEEQAACRPDVRRFCNKVTEDQGTDAFLHCLQAHRDKLSQRCRAVLESHGV
jgi:hypothetical protein